MVFPMIKIGCCKGVIGVHAFVEFVGALEDNRKWILRCEKVEGVVDLSAGGIRIEKISRRDELLRIESNNADDDSTGKPNVPLGLFQQYFSLLLNRPCALIL